MAIDWARVNKLIGEKKTLPEKLPEKNSFLGPDEEQVFNFKWDSEEQEKGFLNFLQFMKTKMEEIKTPPKAHELSYYVVAYFAQKDHESNIWWRETIARQIDSLEDQIHLLQERVRNLENCP